jgi:hypothetical protein
MNVAFMDLNNGLEAPDLEGSLVIPHMDRPDLGPIAKKLKREKMRNYIKAS